MMKTEDGWTLFPIACDLALNRIARTPSKAIFRNWNTKW